MAVQVKVLIPAKIAESSQTTQYTATNVTTIIDKFTDELRHVCPDDLGEPRDRP